MSLTLSIQGVRGGVGVTTLVAALGQALRAQGERVLLVECSPDHLLGLHLGVPVAETALVHHDVGGQHGQPRGDR